MRADSACTRDTRPMVEAALFLCAVWAVVAVCGCGYVPPEKLPYARLAAPYRQTRLRASTTLDVLNVTRVPANQPGPAAAGKQVLSQSDTVIATSGQSGNGLKLWVNMVVFDEHRMTARQKYFFCSDERATIAPTSPKHYLIPPRKGLLFDGQFLIDPEIRTTPYATEETEKIAILRELAEQFNQDVRALTGSPGSAGQPDEMVSIAGMMMNQVFRGILIELDKSPGLAQNLADPQGVAFPHISLDTGHVQLVTEGDVAQVKIRVNLPMLGLRE